MFVVVKSVHKSKCAFPYTQGMCDIGSDSYNTFVTITLYNTRQLLFQMYVSTDKTSHTFNGRPSFSFWHCTNLLIGRGGGISTVIESITLLANDIVRLRS